MKSSYYELLRIKSFVVFWIGRIVSTVGDVLFTMATMWYVLERTSSPLATAIVPLIPMITSTLLSVPLATLADRLPKRFILFGTDIFRALITGGVLLLMLTSHVAPIYIYFANFLLTAAGILFNPAEQSVLPNILPNASKQLAPANALLTMTSQVVTLSGYSIGSVIIAWLGTHAAIMIDSISYLLSGFSFLLIPIPSLFNTGRQGLRGFINDSLEGFRFIFKKKILISILYFGSIVNAVGAPLAIFTAVFSKHYYNSDIRAFGILEAVFLLGMIIGSFIAGKLAWRLRLFQWLFLVLLVAGLCLTMMPLFPYLIISSVLLCTLGAVIAVLNIPLVTSIQLIAPDEIRGRVMSSFVLLISGISGPIGLLLGGWIMDEIGVSIVFISVGVLLMITSMLSLFIRSLRDDKELKVTVRET